MSRPVYSIRFPLVKEPTRARTGPRFHRVPDKKGLDGALACAAGMVSIAVSYRDGLHLHAGNPESLRVERLGMRTAALWARVFAGHIKSDDPRLVSATTEKRRLVQAMIARTTVAA